MNTDDTRINDLLGRPLWQLTCQQYCDLMRYLLAKTGAGVNSSVTHQAIGVPQLAKALGCSASLLYSIKNNVDFRSAVISRIGRKEVFDIEAARKIANDYMSRMREQRKGVQK